MVEDSDSYLFNPYFLVVFLGLGLGLTGYVVLDFGFLDTEEIDFLPEQQISFTEVDERYQPDNVAFNFSEPVSSVSVNDGWLSGIQVTSQ